MFGGISDFYRFFLIVVSLIAFVSASMIMCLKIAGTILQDQESYQRAVYLGLKERDLKKMVRKQIAGEYEEYAYQILNSNADKERFDYPYISHRPFRYGDVYWIMEHQLQELEVNGNRCFEEAHFIPDEAIIHAKCSEYFFRCCKEEKRIFYDYAKNHVEEL